MLNAAQRRAIRVWLAERDKSQSWLAAKLQIGDAAMSMLLSGHLRPSAKIVMRLYRVTGIDVTGTLPKADQPEEVRS